MKKFKNKKAACKNCGGDLMNSTNLYVPYSYIFESTSKKMILEKSSWRCKECEEEYEVDEIKRYLRSFD